MHGTHKRAVVHHTHMCTTACKQCSSMAAVCLFACCYCFCAAVSRWCSRIPAATETLRESTIAACCSSSCCSESATAAVATPGGGGGAISMRTSCVQQRRTVARSPAPSLPVCGGVGCKRGKRGRQGDSHFCGRLLHIAHMRTGLHTLSCTNLHLYTHAQAHICKFHKHCAAP